jgi:hypothetical protein
VEGRSADCATFDETVVFLGYFKQDEGRQGADPHGLCLRGTHGPEPAPARTGKACLRLNRETAGWDDEFLASPMTGYGTFTQSP